MASHLIPISPKLAAERLKAGSALLVDIREPDEFARRHIGGSLSRPMSTFDAGRAPPFPAEETIFTCRTGMRTDANCDRLAASIPGEAYVLQGGLDAWASAGLPVEENRKARLEMMRQVQISAGLLVLVGLALGVWVHPALFGLAAFVGAGLTFAGATGFCGMAKVLALMPWNRVRPA